MPATPRSSFRSSVLVTAVVVAASVAASTACSLPSGRCDEYQEYPSKFATEAACAADGKTLMVRTTVRCTEDEGVVSETTSEPCSTGLVCYPGGSVCFKACLDDTACDTESGEGCVKGTCQLQPRGDGEPCEIDFQCIPGRVCRSDPASADAGSETLDGGRAPATCRPRADDGEPCTDDDQCIPGLVCRSDPGVVDGGAPVTCRAAP